MGQYVGVAIIEAVMLVCLVALWKSPMTLTQVSELHFVQLIGLRTFLALPSLISFVMTFLALSTILGFTENYAVTVLVLVGMLISFVVAVVAIVRPPAFLIAPSLRSGGRTRESA